MRVGDLTFRVLTSGAVTPDAATLVLVHGIGVSHRYLARLHRRASRTRQVISIDMPGFGGLPKPAVSPTVAEAARALGVDLDRLGLAAPVLIGRFDGLSVGDRLAARRPELASTTSIRDRTGLTTGIARRWRNRCALADFDASVAAERQRARLRRLSPLRPPLVSTAAARSTRLRRRPRRAAARPAADPARRQQPHRRSGLVPPAARRADARVVASRPPPPACGTPPAHRPRRDQSLPRSDPESRRDPPCGDSACRPRRRAAPRPR